MSFLGVLVTSVAVLSLFGCRLDVARELEYTQALKTGTTGPGGGSGSLIPTLSGETIAINETHQLSVLGGAPAFSYSIVSGDGNLDSASGLFTAGPLPGNTEVRVIDSAGKSASATLTTRNWLNSDDFQHTGIATLPIGGLSDAAGNLYQQLSPFDMDFRQRCLIRKSTNQGTSWATVYSYRLLPQLITVCYGMGIDRTSGTLFIALGGHRGPDFGEGHAMIQKSTDGGMNWSTIMDYTLLIDGFADGAANAVIPLSVNDLVAGGKVDDASYNAHWFLRKTIDGGSNWVTTDDYQLAPGKDAEVMSIVQDASGNLYAAGTALDASNVSHFIVKKSSDRGYTWSISDNYNYASGKSCSVHYRGIQADSQGNLYVAISCNDASNRGHWIVRKSVNSGASWTVVDDFTPVGAGAGFANGVSIDPSGVLYVSGGSQDGPSGTERWIIRKSSDRGATWNSILGYQNVAGKNTQGMHIFWDPSGNRYAIGNWSENTSSSPFSHSSVLKLAK